MSEMITGLNTKASGTYKLDSKIIITVYDKPNIHSWFYSWMQPAGEAKLLALPINSGLHFQATIGFISDIRIRVASNKIQTKTSRRDMHNHRENDRMHPGHLPRNQWCEDREPKVSSTQQLGQCEDQ
jgi:hypothetical protein